MLVLSRKHLLSVAVGGSNDCRLMLNVTMVELQGGGVRLGLEVNTDVPVHRCGVSDQSRASALPSRPTGYAARQAGGP